MELDARDPSLGSRLTPPVLLGLTVGLVRFALEFTQTEYIVREVEFEEA